MMKVRFATKKEIASWDELLLNNPDGGNIFASLLMAKQKQKFGGYQPIFILVDNLAVTVLQKHSLPGFKLWYLPKGPGVKSYDELITTLPALETFARSQGVFAIKIESELDDNQPERLLASGLVRSGAVVPNPSTIIIDISPSLDQIMNDMPQKGRHSIKRAMRDGVEIKQVPSNKQNRELMYGLLSETARGRFGIRPKKYFLTYWGNFADARLGQMFFAYKDGQLLAGAYAHVFGKKSTYKDGASSNNSRSYGTTHLLQWEVIKWAKSNGSKSHDLCGTPPSDKINDPKHPHHGIGLFKTAFSREVVDYIGCWDLPVGQLRYKLWSKLLEKLIKRLHWTFKKDVYY